MLFGSHLGNWDHTDNIMRAVLATPQYGLACCMSGEPHWFLHHMGLGEVIGYSARLSMNNSTLYRNQNNPFTRAVYIALMGDPTLRMEPASPASNLSALADAAGVHLKWSSAGPVVAGYNVYRSSLPAGAFLRLNDALLTATNFTDISAPPDSYIYMVRAITLQSNFSGTYFNPSQGIFTSIAVMPPTNSIAVRAKLSSDQVLLIWNSQAGISYHVETAPAPTSDSWNAISESIPATGPSCSWSDPIMDSVTHRFYRVVSP